MKTVFTNAMCAHVWAAQSQPHGRTSTEAMHFVGPVMWSYQTPIAKIIDTHAGRVCLISAQNYSPTTSSKHLPEVRHAIRGNVWRSISVPYVTDRPAGWQRGPTGDQHEANRAWLVAQYEGLVARLLRAQSWNFSSQASVAQTLEGCTNDLRDYCHAFKLASPGLPIDADAAKIWARCQRLELLRQSPEYKAKREKANADRDAAQIRRAERLKEERRVAQAEAVAKWRAGETVYGRVDAPEGGAMLRVVGDLVRTSWGAEAPLTDVRHALRLYQFIRNRADNTWTAPSRQAVALGAFHLDTIRADGTVRAGCHEFSAAEIERLIADLGAK